MSSQDASCSADSSGIAETYGQLVARYDRLIGALQRDGRQVPKAKRFAAMRRLLDERNAAIGRMFPDQI